MTKIVTAFNSGGPLLPRDGVVVGGTWMLCEFLREVSTLGAGDLVIAVPFVDQPGFALSNAWGAMSHEDISLVLVTGPGDAARAWSELQQYPWKSVLICKNRDLHAKVYSFTAMDGRAMCLIGSHNLTNRGSRDNFEAGVMLVAGPHASSISDTVQACAQHVTDLAQRSEVFCDTTKWPATNELVTTERMQI